MNNIYVECIKSIKSIKMTEFEYQFVNINMEKVRIII